MSIEPSRASFALSAFGDEIVIDFERQLQCLRNLNDGWLDLRAAWGVGVLQLDDEMVARAYQLCHQYGIKIACIGSPVGKSPILDPLEVELAHLERIFHIAERIGRDLSVSSHSTRRRVRQNQAMTPISRGRSIGCAVWLSMPSATASAWCWRTRRGSSAIP
jgi:hypothetical protein